MAQDFTRYKERLVGTSAVTLVVRLIVEFAISALAIVASTIFADVIILSAISAEVKGTAAGVFPMKGIYIFLLWYCINSWNPNI